MIRLAHHLLLVAILIMACVPAAWSQVDSLRVMPLGDSITQAQGGVSEAQPGFAGYRYWLWKAIEAEGYFVDFVGSQNEVWNGSPPYTDYDQDHEGHWGWRADEILAQIGPWAAGSIPDIVLIHLGHNDLWQDQSIESTVDELGQIIDAIRGVNAGATFLLAQVIPSAFAVLDSIAPFNDQIPALAALKHSEASPVLVVDHHTGFDPWVLTYDGVHPNEEGEQEMAGRWLAVLEPLIGAVSHIGPDPRMPRSGLRLLASPNPFNPTTEIAYTVPTTGNIRITIYAATGKRIATLVDRHVGAGDHTITWNGRDISGNEAASGMYFVRIESSGDHLTDKITLLK